MSRSQGQIIGDGLRVSLGRAEQLLQDVTPNIFCRMASPGGQLVKSNHPAFLYGHLALYASRIVEMTNGQVRTVPDGFIERFAKGVECVDDIDGSFYPTMDVITECFFTHYQHALDAVAVASDELLSQPNPAGGMITEMFPSAGSMCNFLCCGHIMVHLGQMSAWRRMQGLGPAS